MQFDKKKVDDMVLALLQLTTFTEGPASFAWKTLDWATLDRLYEAGYIENPKNKNKSVCFTPEGLERSRQLFSEFFGEAV